MSHQFVYKFSIHTWGSTRFSDPRGKKWRCELSETQRLLETEFERLREILGLGPNLKVIWTPGADKQLTGEVRGSCVYVYEEDEDEALKVLLHEAVDYLVSQAIEPYKEVTNRLIKMINEDVYRRKEKVIEALTRLVEKTE